MFGCHVNGFFGAKALYQFIRAHLFLGLSERPICEHHLAPFMGFGHIAYIPNDKIVGLSKIPRTLDHFSRQPQNQERITQQVADYLMEKLNPKGVAVVLKARHLCVEMRGVKKHDCWTTTSAMKGAFMSDLNCRQEFLSLMRK